MSLTLPVSGPLAFMQFSNDDIEAWLEQERRHAAALGPRI